MTSPLVNGKVRVLRLFSRLNVGGPSIHVIILTSGLRARGYETRLLVGSEGDREGNLFDFAEKHDVLCIRVPGLGREVRPLDTCLVKYKVENRDKSTHQVGLRVLLDTYIGENDGVPNDLLKRLAGDREFPRSVDLTAATDPARYTGRAPEQVDEFLAEVVEPLLAGASVGRDTLEALRV